MDRGQLVAENATLKSEISRLKAKIAEYSASKKQSPALKMQQNQPVKPTVSMISPKENLLEFLEQHYQANKKSKPLKQKENVAIKPNRTCMDTEYSEIEQKIGQMKALISQRLEKDKTKEKKQRLSRSMSAKVTPKSTERKLPQKSLTKLNTPYRSTTHPSTTIGNKNKQNRTLLGNYKPMPTKLKKTVKGAFCIYSRAQSGLYFIKGKPKKVTTKP